MAPGVPDTGGLILSPRLWEFVEDDPGVGDTNGDPLALLTELGDDDRVE